MQQVGLLRDADQVVALLHGEEAVHAGHAGAAAQALHQHDVPVAHHHSLPACACVPPNSQQRESGGPLPLTLSSRADNQRG